MRKVTINCLGFVGLSLLTLSGCTSATADSAPPKLTQKEQDQLSRALNGKVAGEPVSCVSMLRSSDGLHAINDDILIYRVSKDLVYQNRLLGSCTGLSFGDTLVLHPTTSQYCRGDIARVVDLRSGILSGSCALGDFVPYRTPPKS